MIKLYYSDRFKKAVSKLNAEEKNQLKNKLNLFSKDPFHPSLRSKKIQSKIRNGIFEASINMSIRMTWEYYENGVLLRNIGEHDRTIYGG